MTNDPKSIKEKKRKRRLKDMLFHLNARRTNDSANAQSQEVEQKPEKSAERKRLEEKADAGLIRVAEIRKNLSDRKQRAELNWKKAEGWAGRMAATEDAGGYGLSR